MGANNGMILEKDNGILILTMDMEGNNLMTADFFREYESIMAEIEDQAAQGGCRGLIIQGAGRHFSVGADVDALSERSAKEVFNEETGELPEGHIKQKHFFTFLNKLPFPTVSVVTGFCIGSGSEIASLLLQSHREERKSRSAGIYLRHTPCTWRSCKDYRYLRYSECLRAGNVRGAYPR